MNKIMECIPNFSEGINQNVINSISDAVRKIDGVSLLNVDPGKSTNRTVYTFAGDPEAVIEAALAAASAAKELIDMSQHHGEHPRIGALDVCPFVPVAGMTMEECSEYAKLFSKRAAEELGIPVYLYEYSQNKDYRKKLSDIRSGEYEGLAEKIKKPEWKPDFGPAEFLPKWGATVAGARLFLIAYNVNILGTKNQAHRIALNLREMGRGKDQPGRFKDLKGIGWYVDEYGMAQCSFNLTNYNVTALHEVFEAVKEEAAKLGVGVAGSELIGLIPLEAMLNAADYYIKKEGLFILEESSKIRLVIDRLGLNSVSFFKPKERIIEYMLRDEKPGRLASMSTKEFIEAVSDRTSAPGGGSVSAAAAALGAGLGAMTTKLMYGVRKYENLDRKMREIIPVLHEVVKSLIPMIDADTDAFADYVSALRLPDATSEQKSLRYAEMQKGLKKAVSVPLTTMRLGDSAWNMMVEAAKYINVASASDLTVGARALELGIWGAYQNVAINMKGIEDKNYSSEIMAEAEILKNRASEKCKEILKIMEDRQA